MKGTDMTATVEVWRRVEDFPAINLEVSNWGRFQIEGYGIPVKIDDNGYPYIYVPTPYAKRHLAHLIVCKVFNGPPPYNGARCRFKDDVRTHLTPDNLQWSVSAAMAKGSIEKLRKSKPEAPKESKENRKGKHYWEDLPPPLKYPGI